LLSFRCHLRQNLKLQDAEDDRKTVSSIAQDDIHNSILVCAERASFKDIPFAGNDLCAIARKISVISSICPGGHVREKHIF
jgi:hypothetical protein